MLDPASIERLAELPERNDPLLNVALAEEGGAGVLFTLSCFGQLGADALEAIAERVARERDTLFAGEEQESLAGRLERRLVAHPNAARSVRDRVLARHAGDPFFVLAAAAHHDATPRALEAAACWPSRSPLHDRPWLLLLAAARGMDELLGAWAASGELLREAAAVLTSSAPVLDRLAADPSRRVRRGVASNPRAVAARARLAAGDPAAEVRARAARPVDENPHDPDAGLAAAESFMRAGGALGPDVRRALLETGPGLDEEGGYLAARHLAAADVSTLLAEVAREGPPLESQASGIGLGLGLALRSAPFDGEPGRSEDTTLTAEIAHVLTKRPDADTRLTGKARVARVVADCVARARVIAHADLPALLARGALASDRLVLGRSAAGRAVVVPNALPAESQVAPALLELLWRDDAVSDDAVVALAARIWSPLRADRELPEDELDLAPLARPLATLERAVLAAIGRAAVSPRAALAAIALEPRRCRYVLSAMPTWKGLLTGARLAKVLRAHAGALSAASRSQAPRAPAPKPASVAPWTERRLLEAEAAVAVAIGDLTATEIVRRLRSGTIVLAGGTTLAAGVEARAALDGPKPFAPLLEYATSRRTEDAAALALWLLLEGLDRERAPSLIASAVDALPASAAVVAPSACEALATLEQRSPGRLDGVHPQSPRGRATVASAIARAYRALGGMRDET